jgi:hypothetical protein
MEYHRGFLSEVFGIRTINETVKYLYKNDSNPVLSIYLLSCSLFAFNTSSIVITDEFVAIIKKIINYNVELGYLDIKHKIDNSLIYNFIEFIMRQKNKKYRYDPINYVIYLFMKYIDSIDNKKK